MREPKFKKGDLVVVLIQPTNFVKGNPYVPGYTFTVGATGDWANSQQSFEIWAEDDADFCTYERLVDFSPIHNSPLIKALG